MSDLREDRAALFDNLQSAETQPQFWDRVADDVDWTVEDTHPLADRYRGKNAFIDSTFKRLAGVLPGGAKLHVQNLFLDGDTTIVEVRAYLDSMMVAYTILRNELESAQ